MVRNSLSFPLNALSPLSPAQSGSGKLQADGPALRSVSIRSAHKRTEAQAPQIG